MRKATRESYADWCCRQIVNCCMVSTVLTLLGAIGVIMYIIPSVRTSASIFDIPVANFFIGVLGLLATTFAIIVFCICCNCCRRRSQDEGDGDALRMAYPPPPPWWPAVAPVPSQFTPSPPYHPAARPMEAEDPVHVAYIRAPTKRRPQ